MPAWLVRFLRDESGRGLDAVVLATGTALLIIPIVNDVGTKLAAVFEKLPGAAVERVFPQHLTGDPQVFHAAGIPGRALARARNP